MIELPAVCNRVLVTSEYRGDPPTAWYLFTCWYNNTPITPITSLTHARLPELQAALNDWKGRSFTMHDRHYVEFTRILPLGEKGND